MDAYLIKACFPLVTRNATERLQDLIDSKIEEITDKITDGVFNKTTEFMFAEDSGADNFETTYFFILRMQKHQNHAKISTPGCRLRVPGLIKL